jgi:ATP-binding protein involved in chromosome partitioning
MGIQGNPEVDENQKIIPLEKHNLKLMSFGLLAVIKHR